MENTNIWYWLALIFFGMVALLIGYLIGKSKGKSNKLEDFIEDLQKKNDKLQAALDICSETVASQEETSPKKKVSFDRQAARAAFGKSIKLNDLKIVEGIGPKIEGLFHNYNIKTWKALADCSVKKCQEVLDSGGERYRVHDPSSWPMQARMCEQGKWKELYRWQEEHLHGKL